jgi:hypothetical protein
MSEEQKYMQVFLDLLPNQPKNEASRKGFRNLLRQKFEDTLESARTASWSPDGNWVLFRKQEFFGRIGGAYLVNVRTGQQRQVVADEVQVMDYYCRKSAEFTTDTK